MALATSLESSDDQTLMVVILDRGTHAAYTSARVAAALRPDDVSAEPIMTLSGLKRSLIAVPSARNSGFDKISNFAPGLCVWSYTELGHDRIGKKKNNTEIQKNNILYLE
jgi:hypothetical protein